MAATDKPANDSKLSDINPFFSQYDTPATAPAVVPTSPAAPPATPSAALTDINPIFATANAPAPPPPPSSVLQQAGAAINENVNLPALAGAAIGYKTGVNIPKPSGYDTATLNQQVAGQARNRRANILQHELSSHGATIDAAELAHQSQLTALEDASARLRDLREEARAANLSTEPPPSAIPKEQKTGVQNYGEKFGLTAMDAAKAEDMTSGKNISEKGVWDIKKQVAEAEKKIGPEFALNEERNLVLPKDMEAYTPEQREIIKNLRAAEAAHAQAIKDTAAAQARFEGLSNATPQAVRRAEQKLDVAREAAAKARDRVNLLDMKYPAGAKAMNALAPFGKAAMGALSGSDIIKAYTEAAQKQPNWPAAVVHGVGGVGGLAALYAPDLRAKLIGGALTLPAMAWDVAEMYAKNHPYQKPTSKP